jgi:hypothetical protein
MNRRSFFGAAASVVMAPAAAASIAPPKFSRLSCEKDDPGYRPYCELRGDRRTFRVLLDGRESKGVITADTSEGWVKRHVITERGNYAHDGKNLLTEIVHGYVEIIIDA